MSYTVEDAAWMVPNLTPTEKLVLLAIAKVLIFETRRAQVTTSWLATLTGLTDRTVQQTCARLESAHLIQVTRHGGRIQNEYRVLFPVNWSRPSKSEGGNPTPKMTTSNPENDDIQPRNPQQPNPENDDTLYEGSTEGYNEHPPVASANPEAASGLDSDSYQSKTAILKEAGKAAPAAEKPFPEIPSPQQVMAAALRIDPLMPKDWVERWEMHCLKKAMASTRGWEACLRMNWQHDAQAGVLRKNAKNGGPAPGQSMAKHNGGRPTVKPKFV